ncbi:hypothetical protein JTE90_020710 [Oedothorax gibbosus]|uniref:SUMO-activating enzyme subunit n=1 Tax=Oedothorax gibbosus TaxID=931172 RepID=A0AAV6V732_9ARAC|nr:hypothetical protein JTE90_020710 [Oedothorax gibbosus]
MAVHINGIFDESTAQKIKDSNILVVGAGGIGCELLKCLVLTGFEKITVVDLDTIELSNLNRQFLFHRQHISRPKAIVAKESVLRFNPRANIIAHHDTINNPKFDHGFFQSFSLVTNALDNVAARSHVNRMCMKAGVPLIESGSAGYLGQATVYKKGVTECFECLPRKGQRTYPSCTIRNTPSEPVHCIVWAKHLFSQLFGEIDDENEVSPDMADPELGNVAKDDGNINRVSTREWAKSISYDPTTIFNKLFKEDIHYLNTMNDLWDKRKRPVGLDWDTLPDAVPGSSTQDEGQIKDHVMWSLKKCGEIFAKSLSVLKNRSEEAGPDSILTWDKDDDVAVDFVAACSNLRSHCFHIQQKNRFDVKAIAGNIIPAIASTNDVISGLIVLQAIQVLKGDFSKCKTTWLNENACANKMISSSQLEKPNPKCFVCSDQTPKVIVRLNLDTFTVRSLEDKILKERLHLVQPEVTVQDTARVIISGDPEEMDDSISDKTLAGMNIPTGDLHCEDDLQQYKVVLTLCQCPDMKDQEFEFEGDVAEVRPQSEEGAEKEKADPDITETDIDVEEVAIEEVVVCEPIKENLPTKNKIIEEDENGVVPPAKRVKIAE